MSANHCRQSCKAVQKVYARLGDQERCMFHHLLTGSSDLEGMLQLDTNTSPPTLTNISVPTYVGPRMNGAMVHVPVGNKGIIVQIAGQEPMNPTQWGVPIPGANQQNTAINNTYVDIYDIESGFWFRQQTFGVPDIPTARADICVILVTALDKSSYNIFMIAGVCKSI